MLKRRLIAIIGAPLLLLLSACQSASFDIANLPAAFGVQRSTQQFAPGARGELDVFTAKAARDATAKRPLLVFFYGGGFDMGSRRQYRFAGAALAKLGYVTVLPDYRLYPEVRFPTFLDDAARAVAFAQAHAAEWGADPQRIVLAGHSAGAYIAAMLALDPQYLQRAGADPKRIAALIGLSGPYDLDPNSDKLRTIFGAPYTPDDYRPVRFAGRGDPPTLLLHGTADKIVYVSHAQKLYSALRDAAVPVTLGLYEKRGHADTVASLSVPARWRSPALRDIEQFLATL
ncbi:MAG: alpha/beta hydrolase [Steroidobacteraceae bacterium]